MIHHALSTPASLSTLVALTTPPTPSASRSPWLVWLLVPVTCHLYGYYWWYASGHELKDYLERDDLNPEIDLLLSLVSCGLYALFVLPFRFGKLVQAAQQRAGLPQPADHGLRFCLTLFAAYAGYGLMQHELNKVWRAAEGGTRSLEDGLGA